MRFHLLGFARLTDVQAIRFGNIDWTNKNKQQVAAYFQRFDEAESLYREIDRKEISVVSLQEKRGQPNDL